MHVDLHVHVHQTICSLLTNIDTMKLCTVCQISDTRILEDVSNVYQGRNLASRNKFTRTCTFSHCQMSEEHARSSMCWTIYQ